MVIDYESRPLYHILQSAKQILNAETERAKHSKKSGKRERKLTFGEMQPDGGRVLERLQPRRSSGKVSCRVSYRYS